MLLNTFIGENTLVPNFHRTLFVKIQRYIPMYGFDCAVRMVSKENPEFTYERLRFIWLNYSMPNRA